MDWRVSILNGALSTLRFRRERSITGRHDPRGFHHDKQMAVITQRWKRSQLDGSLLEQRLHLLRQGFAPDGVGAISRIRDGVGALQKGMRYPSRRTSTTQGSAPSSLQVRHWSDRQPPIAVGQGQDSYRRKPLPLVEERTAPLLPRPRFAHQLDGEAERLR